MYQFNPYHNMLMAHAMQFGGGQGFGVNQMSRFMGQDDMPDSWGGMRRSMPMMQQPWHDQMQPQQPSYGFGNEQRQPMQQPQQQQTPPQQMMALPPQFNGGFGGF